MSETRTLGPLTIKRSSTPDNTGGYDWAIADTSGDEPKILAECFEHVGYAASGGYDYPDDDAIRRRLAVVAHHREVQSIARGRERLERLYTASREKHQAVLAATPEAFNACAQEFELARARATLYAEALRKREAAAAAYYAEHCEPNPEG